MLPSTPASQPELLRKLSQHLVVHEKNDVRAHPTADLKAHRAGRRGVVVDGLAANSQRTLTVLGADGATWT
jgi:hypothetical protein